jgi:hypothetical protein
MSDERIEVFDTSGQRNILAAGNMGDAPLRQADGTLALGDPAAIHSIITTSVHNFDGAGNAPPQAHNQDATTITSGTLDGDRLPGMSAAKLGGVPATGAPSGLFLRDDSSWQAPGVSGVPTGFIGMWHGALIDVPAGWALCDGSAGTPDLRNMFIMANPLSGISYPITGVNVGADTFTVTGDVTAIFVADVIFYVSGSTGNDGRYICTGSVFGFPSTTISVAEDITDATADGSITILIEPGYSGGSNTHSHNNHVFTQPNNHSNHVFTQPGNHTNLTHSTTNDSSTTGGTAKVIATTHTISAHSGGAVDAHSAHAGGAVDAHSIEDNIPVYFALAFIMKT